MAGHALRVARVARRGAAARRASTVSEASRAFFDPRRRTFSDLGVKSAFLASSLDRMGVSLASAVQAEAVPAVFRALGGGPAVVVGAQTGAGKTLAYLVPAIEAVAGHGDARAVVVAPGRDLVRQVAATAGRLLDGSGLEASTLVGTDAPPPLSVPAGVVVTTPSCLARQPAAFFGEARPTLLAVFDEADLLAGSAARDVAAAARALRRARPAPPPLVFVGATLPPDEFLRRHAPGAERVQAPHMHEAPAAVQQWVLPKGGEAPAALAARLVDWDARRVLVFVNSAGAADEVAAALAAAAPAGSRVAAFHRLVPGERRAELLARGGVLVCTDLASRGLDYDEGVDQVVQLDFARNAADHLHRVGRTGRAGRPAGRVVNVVDGPLAEAVRAATEAGRPVSEAMSRRRGFRRRFNKRR